MLAHPRPKKSILPPPSKKRIVQTEVKEVIFDTDARASYLTGFHKRKQARIKHAQEVAEKKAKDERREMRNQVREERKQAVEAHVKIVERILREAEQAGMGDADEEDEWQGISNEEKEVPLDQEEEYVDEDRYTTVKIEAVSVDRDGLHKRELEESSDIDDKKSGGKLGDTDAYEATRKVNRKPAKKKKKFRYETKFERDLAKVKKAKKGQR